MGVSGVSRGQITCGRRNRRADPTEPAPGSGGRMDPGPGSVIDCAGEDETGPAAWRREGCGRLKIRPCPVVQWKRAQVRLDPGLSMKRLSLQRVKDIDYADPT